MYEWLLIFGLVLWLSLGAWYLRRPIASTYHPITFYLIFHGVLFAIRPVLAWWLDYAGIYSLYQFDPTMDEKATALIVADLALIVFVVIAARIGNLPFSRASVTRRGAAARLDAPLLLTIALATPLAIVSLRSGFATGTGNSTMITTAAGVAINTTGNGYFADAALMLGPIVAITAWAGRFRWWALLPALGFVLAKAGTGGRWPFVMAVMSIALFYLYEQRARWPTPRLVLPAVALVALFTVVGDDRGAAIRGLFGSGQVETSRADYFRERPLEQMDYGNLEFLEYIVHVVPGRTGTYDYFLSNLQIFTEPVPRVLWSGKPVGAPIKRFALTDYGTPIGMTASLPGQGWMQAGWIGVVVWTALFAWFYGFLYQAYVRSSQTRIQTAFYLIMLPVTLQTFRDGALLTILKTCLFPLLPIALWWALDRLRRMTDPAQVPTAGAMRL